MPIKFRDRRNTETLAEIMAEDDPCCFFCGEPLADNPGRFNDRATVHHVIPGLKWKHCSVNCVGAHNSCHNQHHDRERKALSTFMFIRLGPIGKRWRKKRGREKITLDHRPEGYTAIRLCI